MSRKPIIAGNWKMNLLQSEAKSLFEGISSFFMCFGWISWVSYNYIKYSAKLSIVLGVIFGIIGMLFFAFIISKVKKMSYNPVADKKTLVGKIGKAYMQFQPKGMAQIEIEFNSKLEILDAVNLSDIQIQSFEQIKVVKVENDIIYIEKV